MALIKDYELHGTGMVVANAYHVITSIATEKRTKDIPSPPDKSRPDGKTPRDESPDKDVYWKQGYVGRIAITVWKDQASYEAGMEPIGFIGMYPTENTHKANITTPGKPYQCLFMVNVNSPKSEFEQAYTFLKTKTDYYKDAQDA